MDNATIIVVNFLTDPAAAVQEWRFAALRAEELRCELKAAQAAAYLGAVELHTSIKVTDGFRDAYAITQTAELAQRAAAAAVHAKVAERWADFVLERGLQTRLAGAVEELQAMKREVLNAGE